jgi:hypothetical protein
MSPRRCRRPRPEACRPPVSLACSTRPRSRGSAGLPSTWASSSASSSSRWYSAASRRSSFPLFLGVLYLDFWLLAYPHVASTYTRIAFDRASARRHWFLLLGLPPLVFAATASVSWFGGVLALNTIYFCWQSWHYTRQSHGIARAYRRAALPGVRGHDRLSECVVFGFPVWGLLHRAHQQTRGVLRQPDRPGRRPRRPGRRAGLLALGALAAVDPAPAPPGRPPTSGAGPRPVRALARRHHHDQLPGDLRHHRGWLFINIWHNAQYLLFVWAQNARRFRGGREPARPFLSWLCQPASACTTPRLPRPRRQLLLGLLGLAADSMAWQTLPLVLICHQTVNFHHYIVDAVIWRSPRPAPAR